MYWLYKKTQAVDYNYLRFFIHLLQKSPAEYFRQRDLSFDSVVYKTGLEKYPERKISADEGTRTPTPLGTRS
jgi:hypothetical protein